MDPLSDFFTKLLAGLGLIDIAPMALIPTWSNRRIGFDSICKRLDRLLLSMDFLDRDFILKQWIGLGGNLDHQPVFLQISSSTSNMHFHNIFFCFCLYFYYFII